MLASLIQPDIQLYNYKPELESFKDAVLMGLSLADKRIPPKFFYDTAGSELFEAILQQPEYYIPNTEKALLMQHADELAYLIRPKSVIIEPGSGSCEKIQLLLDSIIPAAYVPMDISSEFLLKSSLKIYQKFPWLDIYPTCVDFTQTLIVPDAVPPGRRTVFIPGSSLGNFHPHEVCQFLLKIYDVIGKDGGLLVGVDRKKDPALLNAAYNDAAGVTAEFNMNLLKRINNELDGNFNMDKFNHLAYYNPFKARVEMHLVSQETQFVQVAGQEFRFSKDESIHTENSYKYSPEEFISLACASGFNHRQTWADNEDLFSLYFFNAQGDTPRLN